MAESTLTTKGQTTLPKSVRKALGLTPGDKLRYLLLDNGEVRLYKPRSALSLAGSLQRDGQTPRSLDDMEAAIAEGAAE